MDLPDTSPKIFLLSPASLTGERARQLLSPDARFETARRYRSPEGVPIEEAFAFLSSLYFRGKIEYGKHFMEPPENLSSAGVLIIAPGFGLVPAGWTLDRERMETLRRTPIDLKNRAYAGPMREHAEVLREALPEGTRVVLLGSIATGKYVDLLLPVFGDRLLFPSRFVGIGDMSRGSILLRAVREDRELEYSTLDVPRHKKREPKADIADIKEALPSRGTTPTVSSTPASRARPRS